MSTQPAREIRCRDRRLPLDQGPLIVGILNLTDDSFFDGGQHNSLPAAVSHARLLVAEGASVIDIGGQSTRPGYTEVGPEEEIRRVVPVIRELVRHVAAPLSIDTYHRGRRSTHRRSAHRQRRARAPTRPGHRCGDRPLRRRRHPHAQRPGAA